MADGLPLELVVMGFPESEVPEPVDVALRRLTFLGDLRVVEATEIVKAAEGAVTRRAVEHLVTREPAPDQVPVLADEEVETIGQMLQPGRTALALVLEHTWVNELGEAFRKGRGAVLVSTWVDGPSSHPASD